MRIGPSKAGFSLVEMLVVVTMVGILLLMAIPRAERSLARSDIVAARVAFHTLYLRARSAAIQTRRPMTISFASGTAYVTSAGTSIFGSSTLALPFQGSHGVTANASGSSLVIQPTGLVSSGTPFVLELVKRGIHDTVSITGYGRIQ